MSSRILCLVAIVACLACDGDEGPEDERFTATLNGSSESPPRTTNATGNASFTNEGSSGMDFELNVQNMTNVTAAHIHLGAAGTNGGIIVPLFGTQTPLASVNGRLSAGTITQSTIVGIGTNPPISTDSLLALMRSGNAYVNVHSTTFPAGEIRGQIRPR